MSKARMLFALVVLAFLALAPLNGRAQSTCTLTVTPDPSELTGTVVTVGSSSFELDVDGDGTADHTINVDSNTQFEGVADLSGLEPGDLVRVSVEDPDATDLLAEEVELLFDEDEDGGVTGRIACVDPTSGEATAIHLVFAPSTPDHAFPALTIQVNLQGGTKYKVNKGNIDISGFTFDASNLSPGQRVTAAGAPFTGGDVVEVDANKVILKLQELEGTVEPGSVNTSTGTFQINITSASMDLVASPLTIETDNRTRFTGKVRNVGGLDDTGATNYRIKGLLLRDPAGSDASAVIFIAKKVKKVKSGSGG